MKHSIVLIALLVWSYAGLATAQPERAFEICPQESEPAARLACYDRFAATGVVEESIVSSNEQLPLEEILPLGVESLLYTPRVLTSDGPNFFGVSGSPEFRERGKRGERTHLEFNLSVKYPLYINDSSVREGSNEGLPFDRLPDRFYFVYNAAYDFHALNNLSLFNSGKVPWYSSAPVISRDQSPGLAGEWDLVSNGTQRLRLGLMHHSNGQSKSFSDSFDASVPAEVAAAELEKQQLIDGINGLIDGPEGENFALQDLSRSSNYVQLRYQHILDGNVEGEVGWRQYQFEVRPYYFGVDDDVFWETGRSARAKLTDYDGVRFLWEHYDPEHFLNFGGSLLGQDSYAFIKRIELKTGISGVKELSNISTKVSFGWKMKNLVLTGYYFNGYGKELSTYHYRSQHWGLGLEFR